MKTNTNLIIHQADKGGSIVLLDKNLYVSAVSLLLNDDSTYRKLPADPTVPFQKSLHSLLLEGVSLGAITQTELDYIFLEHPIVPVFY